MVVAYNNEPRDAQALRGIKDSLDNFGSALASMIAPSPEKELAAAKMGQVQQQRQYLANTMGMDPNDPAYKGKADQYSMLVNATKPFYYDIDQGNVTSRANNSADNARSRATNAADNARAIQTAKLGVLGDIATNGAKYGISPEMASALRQSGINVPEIGVQSTPEPVAPTEISKLITERDALPPDSPNRAAYDSRIAALGRGQQQSKYDQTNDENLAKLNDSIFDNARSAMTDAETMTRLLELSKNPSVDQGALGPSILALRKMSNAFGIPAGDTGPAEMLNALGNRISLTLKNSENGGGGMPGALSDSDREFLRSMSISLGNSPQANHALAKMYLRLQAKNVSLENMRREYVASHGRLDDNFRSLVTDYIQKTIPEMSNGTYIPLPEAASATTGQMPKPVQDNRMPLPQQGAQMPVPTSNMPLPQQGAQMPVPQGIDPRIWGHMTPEERKLWQ